MEQNEKDFEQYLGGAPREVVEEFAKPGELSVEDLDFSIGGLDYQVSVESQLDKTQLFSEERLQREKETADMLKELAQIDKSSSNEMKR